MRTPIRAPNANAYAERVIETIRAECLDWTLIQGPPHLDRTLRTYAEHYNRGRPHRALGLAPPLTSPFARRTSMPTRPSGSARQPGHRTRGPACRGGGVAPGQLVHVAGPIAGGWQVVNVYESQEAADTWNEKVMAARKKAGMPEPQPPKIFPVHRLAK